MEAAQKILSLFIEEGILFQVALNDGEVRQVPALGQAIAPDIPLVLLVDDTSISAAEVVAASIQYHDRGLLMGDTTYGKGTVQTTLPMPQKTALQFTIAHWLTPAGEWLNGRGVEPDMFVVDDPDTVEDEIINEAVDLLKKSQQ